MPNFKRLTNSINFLFSLSIALLVAYAVNNTLESERRLRLALEQEDTFDEALIFRGEIESKLSNTRLIPFTFRSQLRKSEGFSHSHFAELSNELISQSTFIRNISLIKNNTVIDIYPRAYGQAELGDVFTLDAPMSQTFFSAREKRQTVISPPYSAEQNIVAVDLSTPLFLEREYWGQINITIDWNELLNSDSYQSLAKDYNIDIYDVEQAPVNNQSQPQERHSIYINTNLIHQLWEIKITPKTHWHNNQVKPYHHPSVAFSFLFTFFSIFYWLRQNQALRKERNAALEAIQEKNRFLSYAAHDLRQPLSALSFSIEELLQRQKSLLDSRITKNMLNSIQNLNELFDQLLDIEQINHHKKVISLTVISLCDLIEELSSELDPLFKEYKIELLSHCEEIYIKTDPVLLKRILRNLVINGLESTSQGYVSLVCDINPPKFNLEGSRTVKIRVRDTGKGIDIKDQNNIFNAFQQRNEKVQQVSVGIGAGLNIVKNYCRLLNIPIEIDSTKGIGSEFILSLDSHPKPALNRQLKHQQPINLLPSPLNGIQAYAYHIEKERFQLLSRWGLKIQHCTVLSSLHNQTGDSDFSLAQTAVLVFIDANTLLQQAADSSQKAQIQATLQSYPTSTRSIIIGEEEQLDVCREWLGHFSHITFSNEHTVAVRFRANIIQCLEDMPLIDK